MRARSSKRASSVLASTSAREPLVPPLNAESGEGDDRDADGERLSNPVVRLSCHGGYDGGRKDGPQCQDDDDGPRASTEPGHGDNGDVDTRFERLGLCERQLCDKQHDQDAEHWAQNHTLSALSTSGRVTR